MKFIIWVVDSFLEYFKNFSEESGPLEPNFEYSLQPLPTKDLVAVLISHDTYRRLRDV